MDLTKFDSALVFAGLGFSVVFAVLIILMVVILLMKIFAKNDAPKAPVANKQTSLASAPAANAAIDVNETIAVISATVAAMSGDDPNKRLRVKSIKDQSGNVLWSTNK